MPGFRWFVVSVLTMAMGAQIQGVVVAWQIYAITHNPLSLGMVGLAEAVPFIGLALWAGHVADSATAGGSRSARSWCCSCARSRWRSRACFVSAGVGPLDPLAIYGVIVICGVARSFLLPARNALAAEVVPRPLFSSAVAWRTGIWQVAAVTGPALGGLLYGWVGATCSYSIAAALMAGALVRWCGSVLRARGAAAPAAGGERAGGAAFLFSRAVFLGAMTLDLLAVLFGGAVAILPIFAEEILHVGPQGLGVLRAAPAIGAVRHVEPAGAAPAAAAGRAAFLVGRRALRRLMIAFALSRSFWLSLPLLAVSGAADMLSVYFRSTLMQVLVPPAMLGRVSAVNQIFIGSSNEIGAFESGVAARLLGTVPSVVVGGVITVVVTLVTAWCVPALPRLDRLEEQQPQAEVAPAQTTFIQSSRTSGPS